MLRDGTIRYEQPADIAAVRRVNLAAFETPAEADLVDAFRAAVESYISLVAEINGEIVGHILFTPLTVHPDDGGKAWDASALGPMAVLPSHQNRGVGSALVRFGLDSCRTRGHDIVFVLGHPQFYPRFGFAPARPRGLRCTWNVPDDAFMVAELTPNVIAGRAGLVKYHALFESV